MSQIFGGYSLRRDKNLTQGQTSDLDREFQGSNSRSCRGSSSVLSHRRGFTLIEFSIVMAILGILAAIAVPALFDYLYKARVANTVCELKSIEMDVISYNMDNGGLPPSLKEVGWADAADPWGNSYVYVPVDSVPKGKLRKDKFLVPVNTDFDLYSPGRDGKSRAPFTAKSSRDDVVRANNGDYFGLVEGY